MGRSANLTPKTRGACICRPGRPRFAATSQIRQEGFSGPLEIRNVFDTPDAGEQGARSPVRSSSRYLRTVFFHRQPSKRPWELSRTRIPRRPSGEKLPVVLEAQKSRVFPGARRRQLSTA